MAAVCCPACIFGSNMEKLAKNEAQFAGNSALACTIFEILYLLTHAQIIFTMVFFCAPIPILPPCSMFVHAQGRRAIRLRYQLPETPCPDEIVTCFCVPCTIVQVRL